MHDDGELVAAKPGEGGAVVERIAEAVGDLLEHDVPELVAEGVIDGLEVVDVEQHDGERPALALGDVDLALEGLGQHHPVGQFGERVVIGAVAVDRGLAAPDVHREHRDEAHRYERECRVGGGDDGRGEGEQAAGRPGLKDEVVADVAGDREPGEERGPDTGQSMVDGEEGDAGGEHAEYVGPGDGGERRGGAGEGEHRAGGDHGQCVLRGVEDDLDRVDALDGVGDDDTEDIHERRRSWPEADEDREGEGRGDGDFGQAAAAWHRDRQQLTGEGEHREQGEQRRRIDLPLGAQSKQGRGDHCRRGGQRRVQDEGPGNGGPSPKQ